MATWTLAALYTVVIPRVIGPYGMGQLVTVLSAIGILIVVVSLGTRMLVVTEIARNPASTGRYVTAAIAARLALFVPGAGLMAAYILLAHFDRYQIVLLVVATASVPLVLVGEVLQAAFQGLERMQYLAYLDIINKTLTTAGGIVLVLLGFRLLGLISLGAFAAAVVLAISINWARSHFDVYWRVDVTEVRRMIVASLPFWATTVFLTIYMWIDSVMLVFLSTPFEVGWYGAPTRLFATLLFIPVLIGTATLARLTASHRNGLPDFRRELTPIVESTLVISFPVAAGTVAVAGPLVGLLYGPAFAPSAPVLAVLALAIPATYLSIVVNQSMVASNRQIVWTKVMAVSAAANPILNLFAIPAAHAAWHDAALGAAWSLLATEIFMGCAGLYLLRGSLDPALAGRVARSALAAVAMGLLVYAAQPYGLLLQLALGVGLIGGLALPLRLVRRQDIELARQYFARAGNLLMRKRQGFPI